MSQVFYLNLSHTKLAYRIYENPNIKNSRTAVLIHGAGVGGEITWSGILEHLDTWQQVIVPDLKGMGDSYAHHGQEEATSVDGLVLDMMGLIDHLALGEFDLVGYSLGGLVSLKLNQALNQKMMAAQAKQKSPSVKKMCLLEPASLDRADNETLILLRENYRKAALTIRETGDVELGIGHFVDSVAPNRRKHPIAEATTQSRLAHRALGFSYALDAVTDYVAQNDHAARSALLKSAPSTLLLAGELSHPLLQDYYAHLAEHHPKWQFDALSACDHSLPFQKPRQIAKKMNKWFFEN